MLDSLPFVRRAVQIVLVLALSQRPWSAQALPGQECSPGYCGFWSEEFDWGIQTCAFGDVLPGCLTLACGDTAIGEIAHAVLVLKNPASSPPEWRVLLVNTGNPDSTEQTWWIWDPATPGDLQPGPNLPEVVFCAGHTTLADGRVFFARYGQELWMRFEENHAATLVPSLNCTPRMTSPSSSYPSSFRHLRSAA